MHKFIGVEIKLLKGLGAGGDSELGKKAALEVEPALRRQTLSDLLHRTAARLPNKLGIVCGSTRWTWREFDALVSRLPETCERELPDGRWELVAVRRLRQDDVVRIPAGAALAAGLQGWGWPLIDAQVENDHLLSLGAIRLPRSRFLADVARLVDLPAPAGPWILRVGRMPAAELAQPSVP